MKPRIKTDAYLARLKCAKSIKSLFVLHGLGRLPTTQQEAIETIADKISHLLRGGSIASEHWAVIAGVAQTAALACRKKETKHD